MDRRYRLAVLVLLLLITLVISTISSVEARTFRKPVSNPDSQEIETPSYQTSQQDGPLGESNIEGQECEVTVKHVRGKRIVTNSCGNSISNDKPSKITDSNKISGYGVFGVQDNNDTQSPISSDEPPVVETTVSPYKQYFISTITGQKYEIIKNIDKGEFYYISSDGTKFSDITSILKKESEGKSVEELKVDKKLQDKIKTGSPDEKVELFILLETQPLLQYDSDLESAYAEQIEPKRSQIKEILLKHSLDGTEVTAEENNQILNLGKEIDAIDTNLRHQKAEKIKRAVSESQNSIIPFAQQYGEIKEHGDLYNFVVLNMQLKNVPKLVEQQDIAQISLSEMHNVALLSVSVPSISAGTWWNGGYDGGAIDVAIVDTGVDDTHPNLKYDRSGILRNFYEKDFTSDGTTDDLNGHGTHVAGIVSSSHTSDRGTAPGVDELFNAKMMDKNSNSQPQWAINAMDWAAATSPSDIAEVLSNSWGWCDEWDNQGQDGNNNLARYVDSLNSQFPLVTVFAAGNEGPGGSQCTPSSSYSLRHPADAYNVITVGAVNDSFTTSRVDDIIARYSSRGPTDDGRAKPDIVAPGTLINSAAHNWETSADFVEFSGTSMAAPHVAGGSALLMQYLFSPLETKALLINTAEDRGATGWDKDYGWGYIDLNRAYLKKAYTYSSSVQEAKYKFYKAASSAAGERATLDWNRHVNYVGAAPPPNTSTYVHPINDLDLYFYRESDSARLATSQYALDNVEQVKLAAGYTNVVLKIDAYTLDFSHGSNFESYSIATDRPFAAATGPVLSVSQSAPSVAYTTFIISSTVSNTGDLDAHAVSATLNLPAGLTITNGANPQPLGVIADGSSKTASWTVQASAGGTYTNIYTRADATSYEEPFADLSLASTVIVDTTKPTISVSHSPANPTTGQTVTITASASDNVKVSRINLFVDSTNVKNCTINAASGSCAYSTSYGSPGTHTYYALAFDSVGNVGKDPATGTKSFTVTASNTPPTVSVTHSPASPTVGQTVTVTSSANDNVQVRTIAVYVDGAQANNCTINAASGSCQYSTSYGSAGTHTYYSVAVDNNGAIGRDPSTGTKSFTVSAANTPPTVSVTHTPANPNVGQTVTINADATDNSQVRTIAVFIDGVQANNCTINAASGSCQFSTSYGSTGTHTYYAQAVDNNGALGRDPATGTKSFTVSSGGGDTTPPATSVLHSPANPGVGQTVTLTSDATDNVQVGTIAIFVDGMESNNCTINAGSGSCQYSVSYGVAGTHNYYSQSVDNSGNIGRDPASGTKSFTVSSGGDTNPPVVFAFHTPSNPNVGDSITITANATDDVLLDKIFMYVDGSWVQTCYPFNVKTANCPYPTSYASPGTHNYTASASDSSGNLGWAPITYYFTVGQPSDTTPPTVSVSAPSSVDTGQIITITADATDNFDLSEIRILVDGTIAQTCPASGVADSCSYSTSYSTVGNHTYHAEVTDSSSNIGRDPISGEKNFSVVQPSDTTKPTLFVTAPSSVLINQPITITADATDNVQLSEIVITVDGVIAQTCSINAPSGNCGYTTSYPDGGIHTYHADAIDSSNNVGRDPPTGEKSFNVVDNELPTIAVFGPASPVNIGQPIDIGAFVSDNIQISWVALYLDGVAAKSCPLSAPSGSCNYTTSFSLPGTYTYYGLTQDSSGNRARDPSVGTNNFDVVDNVSPIFTSPLAINVAGLTTTIIAAASDNARLSEIKIFLDGSLAKTCPINAINGSCTHTITFTDSGAHTTYATAADSSGNTAREPQIGEKNFSVSRPGVVVHLQGQGWITSTNNDIQCGFIFNDCAKNYTYGTKITLNATPSLSPLYVFNGWEGACTGTGKSCTLILDSKKDVYASFSPANIPQFYELNVTKSGSGSGRVTSNPTGISCITGLCSTLFKKGTTVTLTATPIGGSTFAGWSGACSGTYPICAVSMSSSKSVTATFN